MKLHSPVCIAAFLLLGLVGPGISRNTPQEVPDKGELYGHMEVIEEALGKLRRSLRDPARSDEALDQIVLMQEKSLACKGLVPHLITELPVEERAAMERDYRRVMVDFLIAQLELEAALLDGDPDAAKTAFKQVRSMEAAGHERVTREEE
jgi:hypothetical protein